jgi:hypothetical protein
LLLHGVTVRRRAYQEPEAARVMEEWTARGLEYGVRNHPVQYPRTSWTGLCLAGCPVKEAVL